MKEHLLQNLQFPSASKTLNSDLVSNYSNDMHRSDIYANLIKIKPMITQI